MTMDRNAIEDHVIPCIMQFSTDMVMIKINNMTDVIKKKRKIANPILESEFFKANPPVIRLITKQIIVIMATRALLFLNNRLGS